MQEQSQGFSANEVEIQTVAFVPDVKPCGLRNWDDFDALIRHKTEHVHDNMPVISMCLTR
jgi:hypothetical protein